MVTYTHENTTPTYLSQVPLPPYGVTQPESGARTRAHAIHHQSHCTHTDKVCVAVAIVADAFEEKY